MAPIFTGVARAIGGFAFKAAAGGAAAGPPGEDNKINMATPTTLGTVYNLTDGETWSSPAYGPYLMTVTSAGEYNDDTSEVGMWAKAAMWAGGGGTGSQDSGGGGGAAAVIGEVWLVAGTTYNVWVGRGGNNGNDGGTPAFGNGGAGEPNGNRGGGGGLSGIFGGPVSQPNARLIAGAGGGGGGPNGWASSTGGAGGYPSGGTATGPSPKGTGGTQSGGGTGGNSGNNGSALTGAQGGFAGGGAGWYGGGSGSDNGQGSPGGGGGSSYNLPNTIVKEVTHYSGSSTTAGATPSPYYSPGKANGATSTNQWGEDGYMKIMSPTA